MTVEEYLKPYEIKSVFIFFPLYVSGEGERSATTAPFFY
jgi:hypothetical protein